MGTGVVLLERQYKKKCQHSGCHETTHSWEYERSVSLEEMRAFGEGDQMEQEPDLDPLLDLVETWRQELDAFDDNEMRSPCRGNPELLLERCADELARTIGKMKE